MLASQWLRDGRRVSEVGAIEIEGIGTFSFDLRHVNTVRPDLFVPGQFTIFNILVHLGEVGEIALDYHWEESMNTHVVDAINGMEDWWYMAYYDGGWREDNVYRMDHYLYKDRMTIKVMPEERRRIEGAYETYQEEVARKQRNGGKVIIPDVEIHTPEGTLNFFSVEVTPHNLRRDVFREGVVTAIDVILSLGDQGELTYDLK